LNEVNDQDDDGNYEQEMDQTPANVAKKAEKPEHDQDNNYSPEHGIPSVELNLRGPFIIHSRQLYQRRCSIRVRSRICPFSRHRRRRENSRSAIYSNRKLPRQAVQQQRTELLQ